MPPLLKAYSGHEERARTLSTLGKVHARLNAGMISKSEFDTPFNSTGIIVVDSRPFSDLWLALVPVRSHSQPGSSWLLLLEAGLIQKLLGPAEIPFNAPADTAPRRPRRRAQKTPFPRSMVSMPVCTLTCMSCFCSIMFLVCTHLGEIINSVQSRYIFLLCVFL